MSGGRRPLLEGADFDANEVAKEEIIGGVVEAAAVDGEGFLTIVIRPKRRNGKRTRRVLLTVSCDHEGNGPGALLVESIDLNRPMDNVSEAEWHKILTAPSEGEDI